jgi:hypothetical protein
MTLSPPSLISTNAATLATQNLCTLVCPFVHIEASTCSDISVSSCSQLIGIFLVCTALSPLPPFLPVSYPDRLAVGIFMVDPVCPSPCRKARKLKTPSRHNSLRRRLTPGRRMDFLVALCQYYMFDVSSFPDVYTTYCDREPS